MTGVAATNSCMHAHLQEELVFLVGDVRELSPFLVALFVHYLVDYGIYLASFTGIYLFMYYSNNSLVGGIQQAGDHTHIKCDLEGVVDGDEVANKLEEDPASEAHEGRSALASN